MRRRLFLQHLLVLASAMSTACATAAQGGKAAAAAPLMIREQGSFAVGGTIVIHPGAFDPYKPTPDGETLHGDHAYVFYQVPVDARRLPLVFWHGAGQFSKTWETTPDGREGFQTLFLRRRFAVYLLDQPRRGNAGRSTVPLSIPATPDDQIWFGMFRFGIWPSFFPGVQFSRDPEALNQFFRSMTPNTGPFDAEVSADAVSALFDRIGPGILVTHSQGGGPGWLAAMKNPNVRAVVSYEPGSGFVFPEGEVPPAMPCLTGPLEGVAVPLSQFMQLTKIPIVLYFGDNIPETPSKNPGQDNWRVRIAMARLWRDAVNRHGGNVTLVHLPDLGIHGNTHFAFSDTNNVQIADLLAQFLAEKHLDDSRSISSLEVGSPASTTISVRRRKEQPVESAPAEHFTGPARVQRLFQADDPARASGASVTFEPGARTAWHAHPLGQTLAVTAGTGWVQQWGEAARAITEGDVVWIPRGVKHWHGAAASAAMTHLAIQEQLDGKTVQWMEPVSDEQYQAAAARAQ